MSSNQSFSYDNLSQQTSDIRNWGLNDASQEDLIASFTRDNDINAKLDLILSKMVALETKMDKLESSVQQGVQNYYDEMHSSHIVSSLINDLQEETKDVEKMVFKLRTLFNDSTLVSRIVQDRNLHGVRHLTSSLPYISDKSKPTVKDSRLAIAPRNNAYLKKENVVLSTAILRDNEDMYNRTYTLAMAFAKVQVMPGRALKTFSWGKLDGKSKRVYALMFEHFIFGCNEEFGEDYALPLYACLGAWASTQFLSVVINSLVRSGSNGKSLKQSDEVKNLSESNRQLYQSTVDHRDSLVSLPAVNIDFSVITDQMVYAVDRSNDINDEFTSVDQLHDSGDDYDDDEEEDARPNGTNNSQPSSAVRPRPTKRNKPV